jgi:ABC-type uncharacterized transport system YnjBCD substrate-binding protein
MRGTRRIASSLVVLGLALSACSSSSGGGSSKSSSPAASAGSTTAATTSAAATSAAAGSSGASGVTKPSHPVTLNILDIAGNLQLTQGMIDNFVKANPDVVSHVNYTKATAPELAGKLEAEEQGGNAQTSLVLTGTDGLSAGIANNLLAKITPDHDAYFPNLDSNYLAPAADMQKLAQGYGIELVYYPSGPLLEYNPAKVPNPPTTPQALLDWAKAHPGKFEYARPANSGPGRTFLMGLPYLLGDKDPTDPINGWDKTWSYLQQLGQYINVYQTGTTATMKDLAAGTVDMIATTTGWDINPRVLGTVPNTVKVTHFDNQVWVSDAQYAVIPKDVSADTMAADLLLIQWMLKPDQQAIAYDDGYFYPGPAVKGVTLSMAPQKSQDTLAKFGRPEYDQWISQFPTKTSLPATQQVAAFDKWDKTVGSGKFHT